MLLDGRNFWKLHGRWFVVVSTVTLAAIGWTVFAARGSGRWPGGGSLSGLALGTLAAVIFAFEMALVAKKSKGLRTARWLGSAQMWMKAHIWLGLLTVPLVVLHSGGRIGSTLTWLLVVSFTVVVGSGLWGLALQNILPRLLLVEVPSETVYSEIDRVGRQYAQQARRLVFAACGSDAGHSLAESEALRTVEAGAIAGAPRRVGLPIERSPQPPGVKARVVPSAVIEHALRDQIVPYLQTGAAPSRQWTTQQGLAWYFDDLRQRVAPELRPLVGQLEELCDRRRQLNVQRRLHFWLHNWLWLHLPLSVSLMMLLAAHVVFALLYG